MALNRLIIFTFVLCFSFWVCIPPPIHLFVHFCAVLWEKGKEADIHWDRQCQWLLLNDANSFWYFFFKFSANSNNDSKIKIYLCHRLIINPQYYNRLIHLVWLLFLFFYNKKGFKLTVRTSYLIKHFTSSIYFLLYRFTHWFLADYLLFHQCKYIYF